VTIDGYWIDNRIYYTSQPSTTESLRTPSAFQFTTEYITTLQPLYPPQPLFWHPLPTLSWLLPNSRFPSFFLGHQLTHSLTHWARSVIYDLWTDDREDTFSERRPFFGMDSKETSISRYLGNLPCCLGSEPQCARHNIFKLQWFGTWVLW
jgi:hypothetical protein